MKDILISDVVCATNGKVDCNSANTDDYISNITTDSKSVTKGSLFIAIRGGHNYVKEAIESGAICCLLERNVDVVADGVTLIYVDDTIKALRNLATFYRSLFNIPAVAITGSNGKTSTKDLVASVLSQKYNVLKTEGNFNNEIGVPMTIFNLREHHDMLVIEMGMNHAGEIERLVDIVKPDVAIITNIGVAHIEYLASKEGILQAKLEITKGLKQSGTLIINEDDEMLKMIKRSDYPNIEMVTYSRSKYSDYQIDNIVSKGINGTIFDVVQSKISTTYEIEYGGDFMVSNAMCSVIVGEHFEVSQKDIAKGIKEFKLSKSRLEKSELKCGAMLINDAYNASPDSMRASISILDNENDKRKILVLGDMFELGDDSDIMHRELGTYLIDKNVDYIVFCGEMMKYAYQSYSKEKDKENSIWVSGIDDVLDVVKNLNLCKDDVILFKASNGMNFKKVVSDVLENL